MAITFDLMTGGLNLPPMTNFSTAGGHTLASTGDFSGRQGVNYTGAVWGSPIPLTKGARKVPGAVVWAGDVIKSNERKVSIPGTITGPTNYTSWEWKRSFAVSVGKRLNKDAPAPFVRRVWADGQLAWSNGEGIPFAYQKIAQDYLPTGQWINGAWVPASPDFDPSNNQDTIPSAIPGSTTRLPQKLIKSKLSFRFYDGNEDQLPDQAVIDDLGGDAPAFRGLMYLVIEGLVVGKGFVADANVNIPGHSADEGDIDSSSTLPIMFPQIVVELVDGDTVSFTTHTFDMIDTAAGFENPSAVLLGNFATRELAAITMVGTGGGRLSIFDMDSGAQTKEVFISSGGAETIGTTSSFSCWDKMNNIFYTYRSGDHCICSISYEGTLIDTSMTVGPDLAPFSLTPPGDPITDTNPAVGFPRPTYGDFGYVLQGGQFQPLLFAGNNWAAAFVPSTSGIIPEHLYASAMYVTPGRVLSIKAFPLATKNAQEQHLSYQDAAFVVGYANGEGVELVYCTKTAAGEGKVLGRTLIYTAHNTDSQCHAMLDQNGNVFIQDTSTITGEQYFASVKIVTTATPDFSVAPTWKGLFPEAGETTYNILLDTVVDVFEGNSIREADVGGNTFGIGGFIINMGDGTIRTVASFSGADSTTSVWDSGNQLRFYHGNIPIGDDEVFTGHGVYWAQVFTGIDGSMDSLKDAITEIALEAGYEIGDLEIDNALDLIKVPGVQIVKPYDLSTLFNDLGAIYEFSYFNSGGKLKFRKVSNSPVKAGGSWAITGTATPPGPSVGIQDGDTCTIGAFVYRFKLVPVAPFDVKISTDTVVGSTTNLDAMEKTAANFLAALNGNLSLAAHDSQDPALAPGFFAGTVKHTQVDAKSLETTRNNFGFRSISLLARQGGAGGNSIGLARTGTHQTLSGAFLTNGSEPPEADVTITRDELAEVQESQVTEHDALVTAISPFGQAQRAATVQFIALDLDYMLSTQTFTPDNQGGEFDLTGGSTVTYDIPIVMSTSDAYARIARVAFREADNVIIQNFRLPQAFLLLEPSDILAIEIGEFNYTVRLDECTFNGDWSTSFTAVNYSYRTDVDITDGDPTGRLPQTIPGASDSLPVVVDAPLMNPLFGTIAGNIDLFDGVRSILNIGFSAATLSYGQLVSGSAPSMTMVLNTSNDVKWGLIQGLPAPVEPFYRTVEDSITLICKSIVPDRDLASATYLECVEGENCLLVGRPGNWEYIYFRDVTVLSSKQVRLTGLIRAQRGSDAAAVSHASGDVALLLASVADNFDADVLRPQSFGAAAYGGTYVYQANGLPQTREGQLENVTLKGYVLWPWSPCQLKAVLAGGNDINLSWVRRDRLMSTEFVTTPPPMSETSQLYDLEILSGSTVVRTLTNLATPSYTYTSANQVTDGFAPPLATLKVRVYQKGELGRGFPREETLNVI